VRVTTRAISHEYTDPLDSIWLEAARRLGMRVERTHDAYASWDGRGTLSIAAPSEFDRDDSLAQLLFHEICHALVAGPEGQTKLDWGLDNESERDLVFEHACHRVQAALAHPFGLRDFFAVTTEWRPYWDALPEDPLAASDDPALPIARRAFSRAAEPPYRETLSAALTATADIADAVRPFVPETSLWRRTRARHASGFLRHDAPELTCGTCAWFHRSSRGFGCRQAARLGRRDVALSAELRACERWETALGAESCAPCGACCREGFDRVELRRRDALAKRHPELVQVDRWGAFVPRPGGRCVALDGDGRAESGYRCRVYADRPRACAEFEIGGEACLIARRRVGLSR
jgi:hypothetical protein